MKTISREDYVRLNKALYEIGDILGRIGVKELVISNDKRNILIDTNAENIDGELLSGFCQSVEHFHHDKFGEPGRTAA